MNLATVVKALDTHFLLIYARKEDGKPHVNIEGFTNLETGDLTAFIIDPEEIKKVMEMPKSEALDWFNHRVEDKLGQLTDVVHYDRNTIRITRVGDLDVT